MTATDLRTAPPLRPAGGASSRAPNAQERAAGSKPRRGDVEGLRAIAVLAVVAFHGALPWASGGFVGVDIFFVISGFLITGLMLKDVERYGRVRLGAFYARRARRILPLAGVVVVLTLVATALIRPPLATLGVAKDAVATILYASNWWFLNQQTDYLGSSRPPSPLLHFWSLSVEEQFYLVWPLVVLAVALAFQRRPRRRLAALVVSATVIGAASFALCLGWTATVEPRAYLATPTRVWQFMAGGLLAVCAPIIARLVDGAWARSSRAVVVARWVLGTAGLLALLWSISVLDADAAYPGLLAVIPTLGTVAVILAGSLVGPGGVDGGTGFDATAGAVGAAPSGVSRLLARAPLRAVGRVSYAWYLWHWPIVVLVPYALGDARRPAALPWPALCALSLGAIVPAWVSLRLVEDPVRFARPFAGVRRGLAVGAVAVAVPLVAAVAIAAFAKAGTDDDRPRTAEQVTAAMSQPVGFAAGDAVLGGDVTPTPLRATADLPGWRDCLVPVTEVQTPDDCSFGKLDAPRRIVLFGDSHAAQWLSPFAAIAEREGYRLDLRAKVSCPTPQFTVHSVSLGRTYRECDAWRTRILDEIDAAPPALVITTSYDYISDHRWRSGWAAVLNRLGRSGTQVVYLHPTPLPDFDVPTCVSGRMTDWQQCALPGERVHEDPVFAEIEGGRYPGAAVLTVGPYLCAADSCPVVRDHVMIYRDRSHLTDTAARGLEPVLRTALQPYLSP